MVTVAALYLGIGEAIAKDWNIVGVLLTRYYLRGVVVILGALIAVPSGCLRCGLFHPFVEGGEAKRVVVNELQTIESGPQKSHSKT